MRSTLFTNALIFDGHSPDLVADRYVHLANGKITAVSRERPDDGQLVEGAAAVVVAALLMASGDYADITVVIDICGGNADPALETRIKEQRR